MNGEILAETSESETVIWEISTVSISGFALFIYLFLGPHQQHMEIPRLGVE